MHTRFFISKCIYVYILYLHCIYTLLSWKHSTLHLNTHLYTHTAHTDSTACMTTHTLSISSVFMTAHTTHTPFCFSVSALYICPQHTSIIHSHSTRSALSKQVQFISQHKHIIFLVLLCIYMPILLPVLLCTYIYIYTCNNHAYHSSI
jgi:hypothetical protein